MCYTIVGAFAFQSLETMETTDLIKEVSFCQLCIVAIYSFCMYLREDPELWLICGTSPTHSTLSIPGEAAPDLQHILTQSGRLWKERTHEVVVEYQKDIIDYVKDGYDGRTVCKNVKIKHAKRTCYSKVADRWSFPSALMFTLSVITMIGLECLIFLTPLYMCWCIGMVT